MSLDVILYLILFIKLKQITNLVNILIGMFCNFISILEGLELRMMFILLIMDVLIWVKICLGLFNKYSCVWQIRNGNNDLHYYSFKLHHIIIIIIILLIINKLISTNKIKYWSNWLNIWRLRYVDSNAIKLNLIHRLNFTPIRNIISK